MPTINQIGLSLNGQNGNGQFAGSSSPLLITPTLGAALATSVDFGGGPIARYVSGTWTPTFDFFTTGNLSVSYTTRQANYIAVGNVCFIRCTMVFTPTWTTSSGIAIIGGLPFASAAAMRQACTIGISGSISWGGSTYLSGYINLSASTISLLRCGTFASPAVFSTTQFATAVSYTVYINGSYNI